MALSIRNQIDGKVASVVPGEVMAVVTVRLDGGGPDFTAAVTAEAVRELGIIPGGGVTVLIKATEVSLATAPVCARDQHPQPDPGDGDGRDGGWGGGDGAGGVRGRS